MLKTETKNIDKKRTRKFPLSDLGIFIITVFFAGLVQSWLDSSNNGSIMQMFIIGFGVVFLLLIGVVFQFVVIRFPTGWIAKEKDVYNYDLWQSLFYTSIINIWLETLAAWINILGTTWFALLNAVLSTLLFLTFYLNGKQEKKKVVTKAIIIVNTILLIINLSFTILTSFIFT